MKTVLLFDVIFPNGHRELNNRILKILSELPINLIVINREDYYFVKSPNIKYKSPKYIKIFKGTLISRLCLFVNFLLAKCTLLFSKYDSVIYTTYPNVNFYFEHFFFKKEIPIILMNHNNIDLLASKKIRNFFLKYANKVNHIVFAPYMKNHLKTMGVDGNRIYYLPHPINLKSNYTSKKELFALSMGLESNDDFLKQLVQLEKDTSFLYNNGMELTIRSKNLVVKDCTTINVLTKYLSQEEYENLYYRAKYAFVFYPYTYQYRFSGVIMDSLASGAIVIGNRIPIVEHFAKMYPNNCICIDRISEIPSIISQNKSYSEEEYGTFLKDFSDDTIKNSLQYIISSVKRNSDEYIN